MNIDYQLNFDCATSACNKINKHIHTSIGTCGDLKGEERVLL